MTAAALDQRLHLRRHHLQIGQNLELRLLNVRNGLRRDNPRTATTAAGHVRRAAGAAVVLLVLLALLVRLLHLVVDLFKQLLLFLEFLLRDRVGVFRQLR